MTCNDPRCFLERLEHAYGRAAGELPPERGRVVFQARLVHDDSTLFAWQVHFTHGNGRVEAFLGQTREEAIEAFELMCTGFNGPRVADIMRRP